jgi:rubrerythrin
MYKKASRRTGGSALYGWSTRKQTEPKVDLKRTKLILVTDWDQVQPRRKKHLIHSDGAKPNLLKKKREVVRQRENFGRALAIQAKGLHDAAKQKRETLQKWRARDGNAEAICNGCGYSECWIQATRPLRCPACGSREVRVEWRPLR